VLLAFWAFFCFGTLDKHCYTSNAFAYPVTKQVYDTPGLGQADIGKAMLTLGLIYFVLSAISVIRCLYGKYVEATNGWKKHLNSTLNIFQVIMMLMILVILIFRFTEAC